MRLQDSSRGILQAAFFHGAVRNAPDNVRVSPDGNARQGRASSRTEGNARLTASVAVVIFVLVAAEGVTILRIGRLLAPHVFIGMVLVVPSCSRWAAPSGSSLGTTWGTPAYRQKGPPLLPLRLLGPVVIILDPHRVRQRHRPVAWRRSRGGRRCSCSTRPASWPGSAPWPSTCSATWSTPPAWPPVTGCPTPDARWTGPGRGSGPSPPAWPSGLVLAVAVVPGWAPGWPRGPVGSDEQPRIYRRPSIRRPRRRDRASVDRRIAGRPAALGRGWAPHARGSTAAAGCKVVSVLVLTVGTGLDGRLARRGAHRSRPSGPRSAPASPNGPGTTGPPGWSTGSRTSGTPTTSRRWAASPRPVPSAGPRRYAAAVPTRSGPPPRARAHGPAGQSRPRRGGPVVPGRAAWSTGSPPSTRRRCDPDAVHTSYVVGVAWMDTKLLKATLYSGSQIPGGGPYTHTAPIAPTAADQPGGRLQRRLPDVRRQRRLLHRRQDRPSPAHRSGLLRRSTRTGRPRSGMWGRDVTMTPTSCRSARTSTCWWTTGSRCPASTPRTPPSGGRRSASSLRLAFGPRASPLTVPWSTWVGPGSTSPIWPTCLARAGAVRAMELDINTDWVNFSTYRPSTPVGRGHTGQWHRAAPGHDRHPGPVLRAVVGTGLHHHVSGDRKLYTLMWSVSLSADSGLSLRRRTARGP